MTPVVQKVGNTTERKCAGNCKQPIIPGVYAIKKYRNGRANEYYHEECWKGAK